MCAYVDWILSSTYLKIFVAAPHLKFTNILLYKHQIEKQCKLKIVYALPGVS